MHAYGLFTPFNLAQVNGVQIGFFSQFLLAHFCRLAVLSNRLTYRFLVR